MSNKEKQELKRDTKLNLWQRISLIMSEVNYVQKGMTVGEGKYSYKGLNSKDLFIKVNESMVKWGVVCVQKSFEYNRYYYEGEKFNKPTFQREIVGTYKGNLINIDKPEEREEISSIGQGIDSQDKASGKAQTYALKQALLDTFIVATGEDTDNTHSDKITDDFGNKKENTSPPVKKEEPKKEQPPKIKPELTETHKSFKDICEALKEGKSNMERLNSKYVISKPMFVLLQKVQTQGEMDRIEKQLENECDATEIDILKN